MSDALYLQQLNREAEASRNISDFSTVELTAEVRRRFNVMMQSDQWSERVHDEVHEDGYSDPFDTFTTILSCMTIDGYA